MKSFHCRCCRRELGRTDGHRLVAGIEHGGTYLPVAIIWRSVPLHCPDCSGITVWRPVVHGVATGVEQRVAVGQS